MTQYLEASASRRKEVSNPNFWISQIRQGLKKEAFDTFSKKSNLSTGQLSKIVHLTGRSLLRYKPEDRLSIIVSEKLVEMARLYAKGEDVFGALSLFQEWLLHENIAFSGTKPLDLLDTSIGTQLVFEELGRLEHGVYS